jgi:hypothetical protein
MLMVGDCRCVRGVLQGGARRVQGVWEVAVGDRWWAGVRDSDCWLWYVD